MNKPFINLTITLVITFLITSVAHAGLIIKDDFEQGSWKSLWGEKTRMSISNAMPKDGAYAARFQFQASPSGSDSFSELRFDLGNYYDELSIKFDLYIPSNYFHRRESPNNNKFFRLWSNTYNDSEKVGASTLSQDSNGNSRIAAENESPVTKGIEQYSVQNNFITAADRGTWVNFVIYVKAPTDSSNFILKIYKNDNLIVDHTYDNNFVPGTQGYRYGYLMGWANAGYSEETNFYLDNVEFYDNNIMDGQSAVVKPMPPTSLVVTP